MRDERPLSPSFANRYDINAGSGRSFLVVLASRRSQTGGEGAQGQEFRVSHYHRRFYDKDK